MSKNPDILIIGAGIIGAACAWRLAQTGARVMVLEREAPGSQASQAALGVLTFHAKPNMPAEFHQLCRQSRQFYPAVIQELAETAGEHPGFQAGGQLRIAPTEADLPGLEEIYQLNRDLGIEVQRPTPAECQMLAPGLAPDVAGALFFEQDAWVDNTALTLAIVQAAKKAGAVFQRAHAQAIISQSGRVTGVRCDGDTLAAGLVVIAAGSWSGQLGGMPQLPVFPIRGQALAVAGQPIRRVVMSPRGYMVPKGASQTMIGATVEAVGFDTRNTMGGLEEVTAAGSEMAPALANAEFLGAWAGLRPGTPDNLPYIGRFAELPNLIAATGHFRNGILLAPITAELIRAIVTGDVPMLDVHPLRPDRPTAESSPQNRHLVH